MALVFGVDGCPAGWLVVAVEFDEEVVGEEHHLCPTLRDVLGLQGRPSVIAVDVPIGLLEEVREGGRECDRILRQVLGPRRAGSVFSPPVRPALFCATFEDARRFRLNRQSFGILPRVREADVLLTPALQGTVREVHPELSFFAMDGLRPLEERKRTAPGRAERETLLAGRFHQVREGLERFPRKAAEPEDVLDAYAAAWTAIRIRRGDAGRIPDDPPVDARGLRMEVWY